MYYMKVLHPMLKCRSTAEEQSTPVLVITTLDWAEGATPFRPSMCSYVT